MSEFRMPSLGADMEAGTLVEWLVKPGAALKRGDIIAVVETQKGAIEIEVYEDGIFDRMLVDVGTQVPIGTPLALIRGADDGSEACQAASAPPTAAAVTTAVRQPDHCDPSAVQAGTRGNHRAGVSRRAPPCSVARHLHLAR